MLIRNRIQLLVLTILTVSIGGGIAAMLVIQNLQLAIEEGGKSRQTLVSVGEIRDLLLSATGEIDDMEGWDSADRTNFLQRMKSSQLAISTLQQRSHQITSAEKAAIDALATPVRNFERAVSRSLRYQEEGIEQKGVDRTREWLKDHLIPEISTAVQSLEALQQERLSDSEASSKRASQLVTRWLWLLGVSMVILSGSFFLLLRRWIISPIERLSLAAKRISQGQYGEPIPVASGDELGDLAREVESMSGDIAKFQEQLVDRERLAAVGEMTASVAHNIRNPLGSIRALAQGCLRSGNPDDIAPSLKTVMETVDRADRWLRDLLQGLKPIRLDRLPVKDLASQLQLIVEAVRVFSSKVEVELIAKIPTELPAMEIDARRLEQSVIVLLNNAVEASSAGDSIHFTVDFSEDEFLLEVKDEGCGMSEEVQSRLFSPYFTTKKGGLGLGLSLTQRIIHGHGGRIDVVSSEGTGSTLTIHIPLNLEQGKSP